MLVYCRFEFIRSLTKRSVLSSPVRCMYSNEHRIQDAETVVLRHKGDLIALTSPLHVKKKTRTRLGDIDHARIIGRRSRDVVVSSKGKELRMRRPTLEEYIVLTPRNVTPIYPADASLIVSLLDLHPDDVGPSTDGDPAIQILEAGTGHGALTLHLARAIHAANAGTVFSRKSEVYAIPPGHSGPLTEVWRSVKNLVISVLGRVLGSSHRSAKDTMVERDKKRRRAVVHTIDVSSKYSTSATKTIDAFRGGMYMRDVDFHVGDVSEWIDRQMQARDRKPFLSHVILDLPASYSHIVRVTSALQVDGKLLVFNPSITQINSAVELVKVKKLPLQLEKIIEIGPAMTGGRPWNVRFVKPRASLRQAMASKPSDTPASSDSVGEGPEESHSDAAIKEGGLDDGVDEGWEIVCRPKPGDRVSGGGFVALWSKKMIRHGH